MIFEEARVKAGLSLEAIAKILGVSHPYVFQMLKNPGMVKDPTRLLKLADVLNIKEADAIMLWRKSRREYIEKQAQRKIEKEGLV